VSFPYPLPELDLAAPLDRHRASVRPEWIDGNGHMNVGFYGVAFDHATDRFAEQFGVSWPYVEHRLGMTFVLEAHATFERELGSGDPYRVTTQILGSDDKRVHFFHTMYHAEAGFLAATNELLMIHVDFATRRAAPWPAEARRRLDAMAAAHAALPRPDRAGHIIRLKRPRD
jgi:acyl-CoA thioester hydrolase